VARTLYGGPQADLRESLLGLAKNYDGNWADIKPRLDRVRKAVFDQLVAIYKDEGFWTNRPEWNGAKAQVPWISFGTTKIRYSTYIDSNRAGDDDLISAYYYDRPLPRPNGPDYKGCHLFLNYQWTAKRKDIYLTLLPFAEAWLEDLGPRWPAFFKPVKQEVRSKITWLKNKGFNLDDQAYLEADYNTKGYNMQLGYIAYVKYRIKSVPDNEQLWADLKNMVEAYISLVEPMRK